MIMINLAVKVFSGIYIFIGKIKLIKLWCDTKFDCLYDNHKKLYILGSFIFFIALVIFTSLYYPTFVHHIEVKSKIEETDAYYAISIFLSIVLFLLLLSLYICGNQLNKSDRKSLAYIEFFSAIFFNIICVSVYATFIIKIDPSRKALTSFFSMLMGGSVGVFINIIIKRWNFSSEKFNMEKTFNSIISFFVKLNEYGVNKINNRMTDGGLKLKSKTQIKRELLLMILMVAIIFIGIFLYYNYDSLANIEIALLFFGSMLSTIASNYFNLLDNDN
ncbi:hypothetical protein QDQ39_14410 [Providencia rettgeri]|uniref:hypothetical protein n=1 Tax=Providencia TaxID=586 RepID=UPI0023497619|nr:MULTISPECIES: hypothetical protein [Providencia]MDH2396997.1 hypothetical protein [Providencia rettgeri]